MTKTKKTKPTQAWLAKGVKIIVAILLLVWLLNSGKVQIQGLTGALFSPIHLWMVVLVVINFSGQIQRWRFLIQAQHLNLSLTRSIALFFIGQLFFLISLGVVVGEAVRGYYISKTMPTTKIAGVSTVLADRVMGLYSFLCLGVLALGTHFVKGDVPSGVLQVGGFSLLLLIGLTCLLLLPVLPGWSRLLNRLPMGEKLSKKLTVFYQVFETYQNNKPHMALALISSFVANLALMALFYWASLALNTPMTWLQAFLITPLVVLANSLPISFGGLGVGETAAHVLLIQLGVEGGAAVMLFVRITLWSVTIPIGLICFLLEKVPEVKHP